jgi:putative aldouronate transport system permease protein
MLKTNISGSYQWKTSRDDRVFYLVNNTLMFLVVAIVLYPLIFILSASFSSPAAVSAGKVVFLPVEFSLRGYKAVFEYKEVWIGYRNTTFYTLAGTALNVGMTMICAFGLSGRSLPGARIFTKIFAFTMIFSGGLIPYYLLIDGLNLINKPLVMIIPGAISVYNMIIARTFIQNNIPADIYEAAQIDGCSDFRYFAVIVMPLSKALIAVLSLFYAVGHWNAYFNALIFLSKKNLFPLQLFLRDILVLNQVDVNALLDEEQRTALQGMQDLLKYSLIIVATVPIMCVYPFVQRYFIKGVMIGSLKG